MKVRGYPRHEWTTVEIQILKIAYTKNSKTAILHVFPNRSWSAIKQKALKLGIKRFGNDDANAIWKSESSSSHCAYDGYDKIMFELEKSK